MRRKEGAKEEVREGVKKRECRSRVSKDEESEGGKGQERERERVSVHTAEDSHTLCV